MSEITSGPARSWHDVYRAQTARIHDLETEIAALRKIIDQQDAEIVMLQEAVRWVYVEIDGAVWVADDSMDDAPISAMDNPGEVAAILRALKEK